MLSSVLAMADFVYIKKGTNFVIFVTMEKRHIAFCLCPDLPMFGLVSALEVLRHANRMSGEDVYSWSFLTEADEGIINNSGLWLHPSIMVRQAKDADIAVVIAGFEAWDLEMPQLSQWLKTQAKQGAVLCGISNGNFLLANLGLLDGYAATVHWEDFSSFFERYPRINSRYQRFVIDRERMSCSGGASTLDLFIQIVHDDLGSDIARKVSRQMLLEDYNVSDENVLPRVVEGGHQHSPQVQRILSLLDSVIDGEMNVQRLADQVGLSRRELLRLLKREVQQTPSQILNERRLERSRSLIQHSHLPLAEVANAVGFSSQSHLTMRYKKHYGVTPAQDRREHQRPQILR